MKTFNIYGISTIIAISGLLLGLESSSNSPQFFEFYGPLTRLEISMLSASNPIGAILGCTLCGVFCDALGCIKSFQLLSLFWCAGSIVSFFLLYIFLVVVGKLLKGIALGFISSIIPVYIAEVLPSSRRGSSLCVVQLTSTIGALTMYYTCYVFEHIIQDEYSFKWTWAMEILPAICLLPLSLILPESPKWLASIGNWGEAASNLARIQRYQEGKERKLHEKEIKLQEQKVNELQHKHQQQVDYQYQQYQESQYENYGQTSASARVQLGEKGYVVAAYTAGPEIRTCSYSMLFNRKYWKHTTIGIATQFFVQSTGVETFMLLFGYICDLCGVDANLKVMVVLAQYVVFVVFTFFPIFLLDKCRRKDVLTIGMFLMGIIFAAIFTVMVIYGDMNQGPEFPWEISGIPASTVLALCLLVVVVYCSTVLPASWLYIGEIFHGPCRAKGTAVSMSTLWFMASIITLALPFSAKAFGPFPLLVLSGFCLLGCGIFLSFPETRGKSEIQIEFLFVKEVVVENLTQLDLPKVGVHSAPLSLNLSITSLAVSEAPLGCNYAPSFEFKNSNAFTDKVESSDFDSKVTQRYIRPSSGKSSVFQAFTAKEEIQVAEFLQIVEEILPALPLIILASPESQLSNGWIQSGDTELMLHEVPQISTLMFPDSSKPLSPDSGNLFFHNNLEGFPMKAGVTYESIAFLQGDKSNGLDGNIKNVSINRGPFMRQEEGSCKPDLRRKKDKRVVL